MAGGYFQLLITEYASGRPNRVAALQVRTRAAEGQSPGL